MNKINTFLIGVQKAGTSSIYDFLSKQKGIEAPFEIKDYHFFSSDHYSSNNSIDSYYSFNTPISLHGAVNYIYFEDSLDRIQKYNPEAKIIIILRNPVSRAFSAYNYFKLYGKEKRQFIDALIEEKKNTIPEELKSDLTYIDHGKYLSQIQNVLKFFPIENVFIYSFEDLIKSQAQFNQDLGVFLNVSISGTIPKSNQSSESRIQLLNDLILGNNILSVTGRKFLPKSMKTLGSKWLLKLNQNSNNKSQISDEEFKFLKSEFDSEVRNLSLFLNEDFLSKWNFEE